MGVPGRGLEQAELRWSRNDTAIVTGEREPQQAAEQAARRPKLRGRTRLLTVGERDNDDIIIIESRSWEVEEKSNDALKITTTTTAAAAAKRKK